MTGAQQSLDFKPVTMERWNDFEKLFGPNGAYAGCWCMWWRSKRSEFDERQGAGNRKVMKEIVSSGMVPGILGYKDGQPVAWCSVAPREDYGSLNRSPVLKRLDDTRVWSIVCFYVGKEYRKEGMMVALIRGAIDYVRSQGVKVVEAYPTLPKKDVRMPPVSSFMGLPSVFEKVGFVEVARPSDRKVVLRYTIE